MSTILVVDDSVNMRQMISFTLRNSGYEVIEAKDGEEALDKIKSQKIHLVVSDTRMPNIDGFALTETLRGQSGHRSTPVLLIASESTQTDKKRGKEVGASGWITKPFHPDIMVDTVNKLLNK